MEALGTDCAVLWQGARKPPNNLCQALLLPRRIARHVSGASMPDCLFLIGRSRRNTHGDPWRSRCGLKNVLASRWLACSAREARHESTSYVRGSGNRGPKMEGWDDLCWSCFLYRLSGWRTVIFSGFHCIVQGRESLRVGDTWLTWMEQGRTKKRVGRATNRIS